MKLSRLRSSVARGAAAGLIALAALTIVLMSPGEPRAASATSVVYTSGADVDTWDPIFPATIDPNWETTVCTSTPAVGLGAAWANPHTASSFGTNAHVWQPGAGFTADWINAWGNLLSTGAGGSGHSWTKYSTTVTGSGAFVLNLLADNCSWIYLDGALAGFQDATTQPRTYPVTLSGTHTLEFIIFDGGGAAGGMYRLETNAGTTFTDTDSDGLADVQETQLYHTDPSNPDSDGDGVSDGAEVLAGTNPLVDPASATLGATAWQGQRPYGPVQTPAYSPLGAIAFYNYIPAPGVPGGTDPSWAPCGPGNPLCPSANTIGLFGPNSSRLGGSFACGASADYTFYQAFVSIPWGTTISEFKVVMSGADDGARVAIYNSANPGGAVLSGAYIFLGGAQTTTDLSSAMRAGQVNRVVITQMDNCATGNNLESAQIFLNGTVIAPPPSDTTPPVITPTVTGTLGSNDWYTSDVNVSWTVTDAQSSISSQTGCGPTTVSTDTASVTFTCTATSAGGTASQSVTVKRDATAPVATATAAPAPNGAGWNNSDVTVTFTGTDGMSGVASCAGPVVLNTEGAGQLASGTCTDSAGNVSAPATATVNIDKTAPTATATAAPAPNGAGWNNTDVTVTFAGTDGLSGIGSCTPPAVLGEGAGQSATGTCTDNAGNVSAPATASNINIDKTNPAVAVTGAANGTTYIVGGVPAAGCTTTDALSGVATSATLSTAGGPLGTVTVTCAGATDQAGNTAPAVTATYSVTYAFCGFKQPLLVPVQEFKAGSTIPVKFCVQDASGGTVTTATGTVEAYVGGVLKGTVAFRFSDGQYIANVQTKDGKIDWPTGTLELRVKLNDGTTHSTDALSTAGVKGGLKLK